jgi:hypothetical protein
MKCFHCDENPARWTRKVEGEGMALCDGCVGALDAIGHLPKLLVRAADLAPVAMPSISACHHPLHLLKLRTDGRGGSICGVCGTALAVHPPAPERTTT